MLRSLALSALTLAMLGCHTTTAAIQFGRPSPVSAVSVEPAAGRIRWVAEYCGPFLEPFEVIFIRCVAKRGYLSLDPATTCVAYLENGRILVQPLRKRVPLLLRAAPGPLYLRVPSAQSPEFGPPCERELRLRTSGVGLSEEAEAITVHERPGILPTEVALPAERPARDPRRWGWLLVAPVLDVVTIAASIPIALVAAVFHLFE